VRLFVSRVFIMEDCDELLPPWLKFIRGVVDSDDLPLNVSRELLQDSAPARAIKKQVTKKSIEMLDALSKDKPESYTKFWKAFGAVLKSGIPTDFEHRDRIADLLRFASSSSGELTSLADYIGRMKEGQDAIYFVLGESVTALASSPHVEALRKKDYEVLYLTDPVDDWVMESLNSYREKKIVSAMHADVKVDSSAEGKSILDAKATSLKSLLDFMKEVLGDKVKEVRVTDRLADSPACLVVEKGGTHGYVERLFRERGQMVHKHPRSLEINPEHPLVKSMFDIHATSKDDAQLRSWTELLYDQAVLTEGNSLEDPGAFSRKITELLTQVAAARATKSES
jgi:molecular chaperone HtpG